MQCMYNGRALDHLFYPIHIVYTSRSPLWIHLLRDSAFLTRIRAFEHPFVAPQEETARRRASAHRSSRRPLHGSSTKIQTSAFEARGVGPRAGINMAAQRPLLRGQRLKTTGQMKAFAKDALGLHLGGQYPYLNVDDLVDALNAADPNGWNR